ncbi:MAG: bifunctional D-glycero-beta-D-manno-heptose-7-phosphate kinase/D-glycero-beta-D-manno-heptose 1-phosphate adenylyltransferase HldE [Gammaproteobacteria bacterium]|nr:bifunctional D-glycero-beta-D-manno-heptose-7-phosphate kinase/D-glycero-beta-D-manno-heptose 1-phosphate adenylyltransferase HldE [Gammaproteobacteria bacterium]NNM20182.1 bifunctional D-glycero-beta-D-manno-heptose-7-phosphate kinase/D-glycero-beta-D-manno-heptose 1-phosphate adenylyltransferase HldE [Gammaproteobacteria bacterium]
MSLKLPSFAGHRVVIAGDVMLDRYWLGPASRISPEAPVPVVRVRETGERPGGAANVALNLAALDSKPVLLGVTGDDEAAGSLAKLLETASVECHLGRSRAPTITKLRVLSRNQQLIRLDHEEDFAAGPDCFPADEYVAACAGASVVVLSDYAKGTLREPAALIKMAHDAGARVLVDPKGNDFARYRGATLLTPNLGEFEAVVGRCSSDDEIVVRGEALRSELGLQHLLVTRGDEGMTLISGDSSALHLQAETREVYDVTGAGDTVIATLAGSLAAGADVATAATLANIAAGIAVRKLGVATVSRSELRLELHRRGIGGRGLLQAEELVEFVREAQARGERVVMTNGCFDILHTGHVAYLEEAKSLGQRLVVAVNDDESVRRLKGAGRPVVPLDDRMAVLAGLSAVDWVVPFTTDTPEQLICQVLPDVLVKGGDYEPDQIAGADCVRRAGGSVEVLSFRAGRSTSSIIDRIRNS